MTEVLTQEEINNLLNAINAAESKNSQDSGTESRQDKFSREQIRSISIIYENFARMAKSSLSVRLRNTVKMNIASTDQLFLEEFFRSIPVPTVLGVINMEPLKGCAILEIDPAIAFAFIDRMCGGKGESPKSQHELTDIEKKIMEGIFVSLLENLREAWSGVIDLQPRLDMIETNPLFIRIAPPTEEVVLVTLEATTGDAEGMLNFCIPYPVIEPIMEKFNDPKSGVSK